MKRLTAKEIKKIVYGTVLSDAHVESRGRYQLYSKHLEYAEYIASVLNQITGVVAKVRTRNDKRGYVGYVVDTNCHTYFKKIHKATYSTRKELNPYNVARLDEEALAHIYMCDGYTERAKNKKRDRVQNIGWLCWEGFPKEELELFQKHLMKKWNIHSSLVKKPWGFGYRVRIGGDNLQKLMSIIYPFILDCFKYKTHLFYKGKGNVLSLSNAEQYVEYYSTIEDIVRYFSKEEKT